MPNRRRHFFINRPLQLRFMAYFSLPMMLITTIVVLGLYIGIWGSFLEAFSDAQVRNDLLTASRLTEYERARFPQGSPAAEADLSSLKFFKETEKLSLRQQEVFKEILDQVNRKIFPRFMLILLFIAWGSIYVSHKIAGPLYRFGKVMEEVETGNLTVRIHLRKGDEARSLVNHFNKALHYLDAAFSKLKNIIRENDSNPDRMKARLKEELSKIKTSANSSFS